MQSGRFDSAIDLRRDGAFLTNNTETRPASIDPMQRLRGHVADGWGTAPSALIKTN